MRKNAIELYKKLCEPCNGGYIKIPKTLIQNMGKLKIKPGNLWVILYILIHDFNDGGLPYFGIKRSATHTGSSYDGNRKRFAQTRKLGLIRATEATDKKPKGTKWRWTNYWDLTPLWEKLFVLVESQKEEKEMTEIKTDVRLIEENLLGHVQENNTDKYKE